MYTDVTLRLGKRIMFKADLNFCPWALGKMSVGYIFRHNDINVNEKGKRQANITYNQHTADLVPLEFNIRNFNIKLGLRWDYYHFSNILLDVGSGEWNADRGLDDAHYLTYGRMWTIIRKTNGISLYEELSFMPATVIIQITLSSTIIMRVFTPSMPCGACVFRFFRDLPYNLWFTAGWFSAIMHRHRSKR